jgi:hypothetical protein
MAMQKYAITTQWRDPVDRIVFNRVHVREAESMSDAMRAELEHNATRKAELALDGFTQCRIISCVPKGPIPKGQVRGG